MLQENKYQEKLAALKISQEALKASEEVSSKHNDMLNKWGEELQAKELRLDDREAEDRKWEERLTRRSERVEKRATELQSFEHGPKALQYHYKKVRDGRGSGRFGSCQIFWQFRRSVSGGSAVQASQLEYFDRPKILVSKSQIVVSPIPTKCNFKDFRKNLASTLISSL